MFAALLFVNLAAQTCPVPQAPAALAEAMGHTLTFVRSGNAKGLLAQMSRGGVVFGTQAVSYADLADQLNGRRGRYCDLFMCDGRAGGLNALFTGGKITRTVDMPNRRARVVLNEKTPRQLVLGYAYTAQCTWELTSIGL
jgi:hypothetical protein